jgi:hypothetical protein
MCKTPSQALEKATSHQKEIYIFLFFRVVVSVHTFVSSWCRVWRTETLSYDRTIKQCDKTRIYSLGVISFCRVVAPSTTTRWSNDMQKSATIFKPIYSCISRYNQYYLHNAIISRRSRQRKGLILKESIDYIKQIQQEQTFIQQRLQDKIGDTDNAMKNLLYKLQVCNFN